GRGPAGEGLRMITELRVILTVEHDGTSETELLEAAQRELPGMSLYGLSGVKTVGVIDEVQPYD
ncbi:MAG TPA: hypothetical protein VM715_03265, partial [Candidatus Acidoferrum sp.]|nr:hypothetical protein [Candidatus Acidoferrum sp.]